MKIHVISIMWNEEALLPYFLRHYSTFADKIIIFNDGSTDKTAEIAKKNKKVVLEPFPYPPGLTEKNFSECFENAYKKYSRGVADWVFCVDGDEFIYNPNMLANLAVQGKRGIKIIKTTAFMMISENLPAGGGQIYKEINKGIRSRNFDKPIVFDPNIDIEFENGRHRIKPNSKFNPQYGKLALLHYRYLSRGYFLKRSQTEFARMDLTDSVKKYRIARGLKYYDAAIKSCMRVV